MNNKTTQIDVLIITAVKDELDVIREIESDWGEQADNSGFPYFTRKNTDNPKNEFTIAVARPIDKGGDFASNLATRLVIELKPRCLAMVGICAGRRDEVFLGDVIVAERVFRCDGGKLKVFKKENGGQIEEVFQDIKTYNLNPVWNMKAENFPVDWIDTVRPKSRPLSYNYQEEWLGYAIDVFENGNGVYPRDRSDRETDCPDWTKIIERLRNKDLVCIDGDLKLTDKGKQWITEHKIIHLNGPKPDPKEPKIHVAPIGTGHQVKEDLDLFKIIGDHVRSTFGYEMEAAAIGAVAEIQNVDSCIIVKSVSDYGDHDKNDHFRKYAIETSYRFLMAFLKENLSPRPKEVPFILPTADVSNFTGRDEELERLEEMLVKNEGSKICTVYGMSGVGKSALTRHFAENQKANFPDGVIGLRADGKDAGAIVRKFAESYGDIIDPDDKRDTITIMQDLFGPRRILLIFDNANNSKTIRSLIPGGDRCAVIVTTRDRNLPYLVGIPTERRIEVLPLPIPDSLRLLESILGEERVSDEQDSACRIIELAGRLPLALKIVGATLEMQPLRSLANYEKSLSEERTRLSKLQYPGDVDLDVRASISLSLKLLEPEEIDFLSCLSVCAESGFSLQAAMSAGDCDESTVHERLGRLYRFSLLNLSGNRFVFHSLIYLFARELATDQSLQEVASERHAHFFIALLKSSDMADHSVASAIAEEIEDIIIAARWLLQKAQSDHEFVIRLGTFFSRYGHWQQAVDLMSGFLSLAERDEDWNAAVQLRIQQAKYLSLQGKWSQAEAILAPIADILSKIEDQAARKRYEAMWLTSKGGILQRLNRYEDAINAFQRSAAIEEELGNKRGQAMVLNSLGSVLQRQGHFDEAEDYFRRSVAIEEDLGSKRGLAKVLNSLGGVLQDRGRFKEAGGVVQRSYDLLVEKEDQRGQAMALTSLGNISRDRGDFDGAKDFLKRSAVIEGWIGNQRGQAMTLNSLGGVLQRQGHFDEAEKAFRDSIDIDEKLGNEQGVAMTLNSLGGVLQRQGHFDEAEKAFRDSIEIGEELGDKHGVAMTLNSLGGVLQRQGHFDEAEKAFRDSIEIGEELGDKHGVAMTLNSLGGVLQRQGHFDEAEKAFRDSIEIGEELGDKRHLAMTLNSLGGVLQRQGHFDEAEKAFRDSIEIGEELGDKRHLAMTLNSLGGVLQRQGHFDEAEKAFRDSIEIGEELGDKRHLAMTLNSLGGVLQRQGHFDEAEKAFRDSIEIGEELGNEQGVAMTLNSLGGVLQRQGHFDEAEKAFRDSIEIGEELGNEQGVAMTLNSLGGVLQRQGHFDEAEKAFRDSIEIGEELGDKRHLAMTLNSLGGVLQRQGHFDEAEKAFRDSIEIGEELGDKRHLAMTLNSLGGVLQRQGHFDEAEKEFRDSIKIGEKLGDKHGVAMTLNSLGGVLQRQGHFDEAEKAFRDSIEIGEELGDKRHLAMTLNSLGGVLQRQRKFADADEAFWRSIEIAEKLGDKLHLAIVHYTRGKALRAWEQFEKAAAELCESFRINESLEKRRGMDIVTPVLIKTFLKLGRADEALDYCQRALEIAPTSSHLLKLCDQLSSPKKISHGTIKRVIPTRRRGYLYGYITPDDDGSDIYFREGYVGSVCLSDLSEGVRVEVEVEHDPMGGRRATNIRLIV